MSIRIPASRPALSLLIAAAVATGAAVHAQDMQPNPADAQAIRALMKTASEALLKKDAKGFVACCDDYVDVFFLDGTLMKGKTRIAATLHEFFVQRPADLTLTLDVVPGPSASSPPRSSPSTGRPR